MAVLFITYEKHRDLYMTVDVIIPVYKPDDKLIQIIKRLHSQTIKLNKLILINTEQSYFDDFFEGKTVLDDYDDIVVKHITCDQFNHGATRRMGVEMSRADYFVCMTDDAVPLDDMLLEQLVGPLEKGIAAAVYARQCVSKKCSEIERLSRKFNYPDESRLKSKRDIDRLGIKTYFCSNVCAAYNRDIYEKLGGFVRSTIFNEDMIYAASIIKAGYAIYYNAGARVEHYHIYSNLQQLRRNFDLGVSQADHPEVFKNVPSEGEGTKMVRQTASYLAAKHKYNKIVSLVITSGFKYLGYQLGKHYKLLPKMLIMKLTMNKMYWKQVEK